MRYIDTVRFTIAQSHNKYESLLSISSQILCQIISLKWIILFLNFCFQSFYLYCEKFMSLAELEHLIAFPIIIAL